MAADGGATAPPQVVSLAACTSFILTTNAGLEQLTADELLEAAAANDLDPPIESADVQLRPWNCFGRVLLRRPATTAVEPALGRTLTALRSVHDVLHHHAMLPLPDAVDPPLALYELLRGVPLAEGGGGPVPTLTGGERSFRVSCVREGAHAFTSLDIEREAGGALHELYGAKASMKQFDVRVRVDVAKGVVLVGSALNREPLSRRHKLAFTRSVTLKPNVAYALLRLARLSGSTTTTTLLDPCCGSGTLPLEAAEALGISAVGVDKSLAVVKGAQSNAEAAELTGLCTFRQGNCRSLGTLFPPESFDVIVTNAPWGVQTAKASEGDPLLEKIYRGLLYSSHAVTKPRSLMVVLVLRWTLIVDLARRSGLWRVVELLPIRTSHLTPVAVLLERCDRDEARLQVHARFAELAGYFDFVESAAKNGAHAAQMPGSAEQSSTDIAAEGGEGGKGRGKGRGRGKGMGGYGGRGGGGARSDSDGRQPSPSQPAPPASEAPVDCA